MPTLKVGPNNTIQYVTSGGDVLSEVEYDANTGSIRFVDDTGSPAPAEFGETVHESLTTGEIDAGKLIAALDAQGYDITGVGNFESDSVSTDGIDIGDATLSAANYDSIQATIDALPSTGGTVIIPADGPDTDNQWVLNSTQTINKDNVEITGDGMFATQLKINDSVGDGFDFTAQSNIKFSNLTLDLNGQNNTQATSRGFVSTSDSHHIHFENLYILNARTCGINFEKDETNPHSHIIAEGCHIDNNYPDVNAGGNEAEDGMEFKTCDHVTVTGNVFRRQWKDGLEFEDSKNCSASGNVFEDVSPDSDGEAIFIQGTGSGRNLCENITLSDNTIRNCDNQGINVTSAEHIDISGNTIQDTTKAAIRVQAGTPKADHLSIKGNEIDVVNYSANGMLIDNVTNHLTVSDNDVTAADRGIFLRGCEDATIKDNTINAAGRDGIFVDQGNGGHDVIDNTVKAYAQDGFGNGIYVTEADVTGKDNHVTYSSSGRAFRPSGANNVWKDNDTDASASNAWESSELPNDCVVTDNIPRFVADLSNFKSVPKGVEMFNDGTSGSVGPHVFDGADWQGFAHASGSTV